MVRAARVLLHLDGPTRQPCLGGSPCKANLLTHLQRRDPLPHRLGRPRRPEPGVPAPPTRPRLEPGGRAHHPVPHAFRGPQAVLPRPNVKPSAVVDEDRAEIGPDLAPSKAGVAGGQSAGRRLTRLTLPRKREPQPTRRLLREPRSQAGRRHQWRGHAQRALARCSLAAGVHARPRGHLRQSAPP